MNISNILIVDDEEDVCFLLMRMLKSKGYETHCCFNLSTCKEVISKKKVDLILLDINLSDGNGLDLLEKKIVPPETKVIVMSAQEQMAQEALNKGAFRFIAKPLSPAEIFSAIEGLKQAG